MLKLIQFFAVTFLLLFSILPASAASLAVFSDWEQIASEDTTTYKVSPGYGGQAFDAEYLFYKLEGSTLSIGLQTGFDLNYGAAGVVSGGRSYFAGDLALSFDGNADTYEYAFDYGLLTKDYSQNVIDAGDPDVSGIDSAGLYSVSTWNKNNAIYFTQSNPFAMDLGTLIAAVDNASVLNEYGSGSNEGGLSHYRIATFDLALFGADFDFVGLDVHWTMSCGNDAIAGSVPAPVPEPSTLFLFGVGAGLFWLMRRKG